MNKRERADSIAGRIAVGALIGAGAVTLTAAIASFALVVRFARTLITPPRRREEDIRILGYDDHTVTLSATIDSLTPGRYGLLFRQGAGYARVGEILSYSQDQVVRQLISVDRGSLAGAARGRFGGWFYQSPRDLGVDYEDVLIDTDLGPAPAWLIPGEKPSQRWMIGVHGRAILKQELLRTVPVFRAAGYTSLVISYRNDGEAPGTADNRYALGLTEWRDVDAAMRYAVDHGATEIVLVGFSMGGATVLQAVTRSPLNNVVRGVLLDSPVVDWITVLNFQGVVNKLPQALHPGVLALISSGWSRRLTGQDEPIDLALLDFVARSDELNKPMLILHSTDDGVVPASASEELARKRPDIVTYEEFTTARHTRLWNYDPERWTLAVSRWLENLDARQP